MSTPTNYLRSVCPECHGAGDVPAPGRPWWAFWRLAKCGTCHGRGWVDPKSLELTIEDCTFSSDPEAAVEHEPTKGPGLPKSHPYNVKPSPPEPEPADEWERCPNCRLPIRRSDADAEHS